MFSQRGSLLISELVGIAGSVVLSAVVAASAQYLIPLAHDIYVSWVATSEVGDMQAQLTSYSTPAQTWFIPAKDIYGAAQVSGVGAAGATGLVQLPNPAPAEIDVAVKQNTGITGTYSFYAFRYNATSKQEEKIAYYTRRSDGTALCAAATPCTTANTIVLASWAANSCTAGSLLASQIPSIDPLVSQLAAGKTIPDVSLPIGFSSDVLSSNKLYAIQCDFTPTYWVVKQPTTNNYFAEQFQVTAGEPITTQSVAVVYSPPPIGGMGLTVVPNPIVLGYAGANGLPSTGTIDASVTNYHHNIVVDGSTMSATGQTTGCSGIATLGLQTLTRDPSGATNNPPTSFGGTWMQFSVTPTAVGKCTATFSTQTGLTSPDNVVQSASATIIVEGQLTVNPTTLTFANSSAPAQSVLITEPGYSGAFAVTNGCNGFASPGSGGSGPSSTMGVSPIAPTSPNCTITITDSNGESGTVLVTVDSSPPLSWPADLTLGVGGAQVQTTSGTVAYSPNDHSVIIAQLLNTLLGGGIADGGTVGSPCYATAMMTNGTTPDTSFMSVYPSGIPIAGLGTITVDTNGCEIFSDGTPVPASEAGMIAYNASGTTVNYNESGPLCGPVARSIWSSNSNAASALLGTEGVAPGTCSVTLGDGSPETAQPDAGLVAVNVTGCTGTGTLLLNGTCEVVFVNEIPNCLSYNILTNTTTNNCAGLIPGDPAPTTMYEYFYVPQSEATTALEIAAGGQVMSPNGLCSMPVYGFPNDTSMWTMYAAWGDPNNVATITGVPSSTNISFPNSAGLSVPDEPSATFVVDTIDGYISANPYVTPVAQPTPFPAPCNLGGPPLH